MQMLVCVVVFAVCVAYKSLIFVGMTACKRGFENCLFKTCSRKIRSYRNQETRQNANERILKNRCDGGRGFGGEPRNIVDKSHRKSHNCGRFEIATTSDDESGQNHQRKSYRAELYRHETEYRRQRKHKCEKTNAFDFFKSRRLIYLSHQCKIIPFVGYFVKSFSYNAYL